MMTEQTSKPVKSTLPKPQPVLEPDNILGALGTNKGLALTLAVIYHGFSCLADGSIPARSGTVLHTAVEFEAHLNEQTA